ncbi:MAG: Glutamate-1-semialdehyde 2,1-aminomutase 2 [Candidatus Omnitrophica bacterium]|nr:Glutamate-1-semialdehyde 2,1-aminomutase 2 [Candidatus Omnitrophota bacterium]
MRPRSKRWAEALRQFPGGVNSPVRAFKAVGGEPVFMERGLGAYLYDTDGREYVDLCLSWGAIILGHADAQVGSALQTQAARGTSFGTVTTAETDLAIEIRRHYPSIEKIRFTSSGTEAVMGALRLARGHTGRDRVVKFEGCYHGHADSLLVKAGSGLATFGSPDSAGIPGALAELTTVLPYNDAEALRGYFSEHGRRTAAVILEPVCGNMGVVPPRPGFLETLRRLCTAAGTVLIFDEVMTGFRVALGGAQALYGVRPDLTTLGKIIGGGLPVGAFGGRAEIMDRLSPSGPVYQAGTLSGNPMSMAAGSSVLRRLTPERYRKLENDCAVFAARLSEAFRAARVPVSLQRVGAMFTVFFSDRPVHDWRGVSGTDKARYSRYFKRLLKRGVYLPPSAFEACFLSTLHGPAEADHVAGAVREGGF